MRFVDCRRALAAAAAALVLLVAPFAPARSAAAPAEIPIHVVVSLTGSSAFLGKQVKAALDVGEKFINSRGGTPFHLIYHDDQSKPEVAVQLLSQLAAAGVPLIIGPNDRAKCLALDPLIAKGPVVYCLSPTMHAESGSYLFMTGVDTYDLDRAMVRYARLRGWKRIGLITSTDASGNDAVRAFDTIMKDGENRGMSLVAQTTFDPTDISVAAQLARIKTAQPDAIFAWSTGGGIGAVFQGLTQSGLTLPVATSFGNMVYSQMDSWSAYLPKELLFPTPPWSGNNTSPGLDPRVKGALRDLHAAFDAAGEKVDAGAATSWDTLLIVAQVLRKLGPDAGAERIRDALQHVKGIAGVNGVYDFTRYPQRGIGEQSAIVARWTPERREWTIVSTSSGIPVENKSAALGSLP
jgi:branched-chain amino acid transport system substrate-binding protein